MTEMTPDDVVALDLPDDEKMRVIEAFDYDVDKFKAWQLGALSTEVERLLSVKATANVSAIISAQIEEQKATMPSLFAPTETLSAEG